MCKISILKTNKRNLLREIKEGLINGKVYMFIDWKGSIMRRRQLFSNWFTDSAAAAKSLQSCPTLCNPIDDSPPGSPIPGILQARTLEWLAISFSNAWKWKVKVKSLSRVRPSATPWTAAHQAPPSMGFSRQEYWSGVPLPSPVTPIRSPADYLFFKKATGWYKYLYGNVKDLGKQNYFPKHKYYLVSKL